MTDGLPPGEDISIAPNYKDGCVWFSVGSAPRVCVSPERIREAADQMKSRYEGTDWAEQGYEHEQLVKDMHRMADDVEAAVENREDTE